MSVGKTEMIQGEHNVGVNTMYKFCRKDEADSRGKEMCVRGRQRNWKKRGATK
jgi:hypothetical protein